MDAKGLRLCLVLLGLAGPCGAQTAGTEVETTDAPRESVTVTLKDGGTLLGTVIREEEGRITLRTASGLEMQLPRDAIAAVRKTVAPAPPSDPNDTRLMFAETGRPLRRGDGYFSDHYVLFPGFSYGLTDHLGLSGGVSIVPGLGFREQVFYVSSKAGWRLSKNAAFSLGALYASGTEEQFAAGLLFGVATFGPPDRSLSIGIGHGATREEEYLFGPNDQYPRTRTRWRFRDAPIVMVGGTVGLSDRLSFVTESWLFPGEDFKLSEQPFGLALRFYNGRLSADVGFVLTGDMLDEGFPIPWLSFSYHFGPSRRTAARLASGTPPVLLGPPHRP